MLQTLRIYGTDKTSHDASVCNVIMTYELVEYDSKETAKGAESYAVLHRVQIEPSVDSTLLIDVPLYDDDAREHFELMLSANLHGYRVNMAVTPNEIAEQYLEAIA